jgi:hypothetical protein
MRRLTLQHFMQSRGPQALGVCSGDIGKIAQYVNAAQERLLYAKEANEEGWNGGWAEMVFSVDKHLPYITCPRGVSRLEAVDVCGRPVPVQNQFYEYQLFGNGRMPREGWRRGVGFGRGRRLTQGFSRNNACLFQDLNPLNGPLQIQIYAVNPADIGKRVLVQGVSNGRIVTSQDGSSTVQGEFVVLASPFATTVNTYECIQGVQKDVTAGEVQFFSLDPIWGIMEPVLTMEPGETTAWYRRYYINDMPRGCCTHDWFYPGAAPQPQCGCPYTPRERVLVTALAKLDLVPAVYATDYLLIQSLEALVEESLSVYYSTKQDGTSPGVSAAHHLNAIRLLIGESTNYQGKNSPAVQVKPFGSASLDRVNIGMI